MDYRDLIAWQKAMTLAEVVYKERGEFPLGERYGLTAPIRRSVVSIPSNIAEGQGRIISGLIRSKTVDSWLLATSV